ncbi:hypothetical protein B7P43_G08403 [Cryptotermes secundus]|uniref:Uncharacterized protein n=1 Tax=Cryptotermes secundus TaxID=105785 RepID=A0A2J7PXH0_9NEOP|nr:hypothetical protein B7P43_G08403 [Cryptotermes secundus]PNF21029.1 hypothetical protein B7P43_G08403 [Cryptotermes secundus]
MNVTELYERLVTAGILPRGKADADCKNKEEANSIKPVDFSQPQTLKIHQPGLVALLHSGIPCSSCGVSFPEEEHIKYRQHLDWHFHQNRHLKDRVPIRLEDGILVSQTGCSMRRLKTQRKEDRAGLSCRALQTWQTRRLKMFPVFLQERILMMRFEQCVMINSKMFLTMKKKNGNCLEQ